MSELRNELRYETQSKYGNYCSYARQNGQEPIPYHLFSDYYSDGLTVKEIYKKVNEDANQIGDVEIGFTRALIEEDKEFGNCKCGKKTTVRSYGGEPGDYCFDCHFEMLKRINGMT